MHVRASWANQHAYFRRLRTGQEWPDDLGASDVHFPLTRSALQDVGLQVQCTVQGDAFNIWTKAELPELLINREPSRPLRQGT